MSLVNQMLRELQTSPHSSGIGELQAVANSKSISWLAIPIILVIGGLAIWLMPTDSETKSTEVKQMPLEAGVPPVEPMAAMSTGTSVSLAEKNASTENKVSPPASSQDANLENSPRQQITQEAKPVPDQKPSTDTKTSLDLTTTENQKTASQNRPTKSAALINQNSSQSSTEKAEAQPIKSTSKATQLNQQLNAILNQRPTAADSSAYRALESLVTDNPDFAAAQLALIKMTWQLAPQQMPQVLEKAIQHHPEQSAFRVAGAQYYMQSQQLNNARTLVTQLPKAMLLSDSLLRVRALLWQKLEQHDKAVEDYRQLIMRNSQDSGVYLALGISLETLGLKQESKLSFQRALEGRQLTNRQIDYVQQKLEMN